MIVVVVVKKKKKGGKFGGESHTKKESFMVFMCSREKSETIIIIYLHLQLCERLV